MRLRARFLPRPLCPLLALERGAVGLQHVRGAGVLECRFGRQQVLDARLRKLVHLLACPAELLALLVQCHALGIQPRLGIRGQRQRLTARRGQ
jgi:hypothetical protein